MQSKYYFKNSTNLSKSGNEGKWNDVPCGKLNLVLCEKLQFWSFPQMQKTLLAVRKELSDTRNQLNDTRNQLVNTTNQLSDTRNQLNDTRNQLNDIRNELVDIPNQLERMINQRFEGVEGAFKSSFEVGGSVEYYYPVAFDIPSGFYYLRSPLVYDIYRAYWEKAPESLNVATHHYMGLTLKFMYADGCWGGCANALRVLLHQWGYNKGVAKVQLFNNQENRLFVWLRGGGILYHIRSPFDLTQKITIYLEDNAVVAPPFYPDNPDHFPAVIVNPIAVGSEDPNLVKTGAYEGWGF
jgi:hypothetical protein